eukprot:389330-Pleurochrysis_carterae.AAC.4
MSCNKTRLSTYLYSCAHYSNLRGGHWQGSGRRLDLRAVTLLIVRPPSPLRSVSTKQAESQTKSKAFLTSRSARRPFGVIKQLSEVLLAVIVGFQLVQFPVRDRTQRPAAQLAKLSPFEQCWSAGFAEKVVPKLARLHGDVLAFPFDHKVEGVT